MIKMVKPKFFMPIWGPYRSKKRHIDLAIEEGIPRKNCINAENGDVIDNHQRQNRR
jgi:mRNA degradation ribonuclease J1/J2